MGQGPEVTGAELSGKPHSQPPHLPPQEAPAMGGPGGELLLPRAPPWGVQMVLGPAGTRAVLSPDTSSAQMAGSALALRLAPPPWGPPHWEPDLGCQGRPCRKPLAHTALGFGEGPAFTLRCRT